MRALEFAGLFFVIPSLIAWAGPRVPALPVLWAISLMCLLSLRRDPEFDRRQLWASGSLPKGLKGILIPFCTVAAILLLAVWRWAPGLLFDLPRRNPVLWCLILCLYPVFSVIPQGLVYRAFFTHRYARTFGSPTVLMLASGMAFGYMHIVFRNAWAVGLSVPAGLLFAARYRETGSLLVSSVEHALYGCMIFTIGLGAFFYQGPMPQF
jgi:uncharacterized protein